MAKDSYWFRHDSTAGRGLRMRKMAHIYGHWGKGVYWDVIEILRDQSNYCFDSDESSLQMLCDLIGCKDEPKFISWFKDCIKIELFLIQDGKFFSEILCENMANWEVKKRNGSEPKAKVKRNGSESEAKPKHKRREEERREENIAFSVFWDLYGKKVGSRQDCERKWKSLSNEERETIINTLPKFLGAIKDKQYQPHPATYLNQKRWNDEIKDTAIVVINDAIGFL